MTGEEFKASLAKEEPPAGTSTALAALWWDAKGNWEQAHELVNELESVEAMTVHAYLHRKEGATANAGYWYQRSGRSFERRTLDAEWTTLVEELLGA